MTLFHLWNLPGDVLAAPESASGLDRCNTSLSLSLSRVPPAAPAIPPPHPLAQGFASGGGWGGDTAAILPSLEQSFDRFIWKSFVDNAHVWEPSSNQPGWLEQM